jgi:hypothetical protein
VHKYLLTVAVAAGLVAAQTSPAVLAAPHFGLTLAATPNTYVGPCKPPGGPPVIKLDGKIVNSPDYVASAKYSLLNNDGIDSFEMTATFDYTHTFAVHDARTPNASGIYWVALLIHNADGTVIARSEPARFSVKCTDQTETPKPKPTQPCVPGITANIPCPSPRPNETPAPKQTPPCSLNVTTANIPCPTPTPCRTATGAPCPQATPCRDVAGRPAHCRLPDLTARRPVTIGGHTTAWGATVKLTDADAIPSVLQQSGYCAFDIKYTIANVGAVAAGPPTFRDVFKVGPNPVSIQSALGPLAAGADQTIATQAYLPPGIHVLTLDVNDPHAFAELSFANNHFALRYSLTGNCKPRQT